MPIKKLTDQILRQLQQGHIAQQQAMELLTELEQGQLTTVRQRLAQTGERPAGVCAAAPTTLKRSSPAASQTLVTELLEEMADLLQRNATDLDAARNFGDYGLNSLHLTELTQRLNRRYGLSLQPTVYFGYPNAQALASHLTELLGNATQPAVAPKVDTNLPAEHDPVAVVGISGYLPGADSLQEFWQHLYANHDLIEEIPASRWDWRDYYGDPAQGKTRAKYGGFIRDADCFDAAFFNISPREAELMDPQHRLLLQAVWHALEDSGTDPATLAGSRTGLYIGVGAFDYLEILQAANAALHPQLITGNTASFLTNRISYLLDLRGPSEPVCTACSASLVAVHHAVEAIRRGDCDMALAGGVHLTLTPSGSLVFSRSGMLAEDGKCKTFDAQADGYVRGEGVGVVFLKRLSDALRDGNPVYGIVRAVAENHGGQAESLTAPNPQAQTALLREVYRKAGIEASSLGYIEAHGTGTRLGDPIEVAALISAFSDWQGARIGLGSVKTNIGHLETAAGIAGVLKVLLMLQHKKIPGNPHLDQANPYIDLQTSPFFLVRDSSDWLAPHSGDGSLLPRRAGISSFGIGGSNAHIVLEEYLAPANTGEYDLPLDKPNTSYVVPLSANDPARLRASIQNLLKFLSAGNASPELSVAPVPGLAELQRLAAQVLDVAEHEIDPKQAFADYGMTAMALNTLCQALQDSWRVSLDMAEAMTCYNLQELSALLPAQQLPAEADTTLAGTTGAELAMASLARTLQVGRKALPCRAAFVVRDVEELRQALTQYLEQPRTPLTPLPQLEEDIVQAMQATVQQWHDNGQYRKIADYWERGLAIDWNLFYAEHAPALISLPGYPFARQRHWVEAVPSHAPQAQARLHPLLHRNVSNLREQQFIAEFDGNEFFIADHKIHNEKVMSSSAPLEMARAAASLSGVTDLRGLRDVVWKHAIVARDGSVQVNTALYYREQDLHFEVRAENGLPACNGVLLTGAAAPCPAALDLAQIKARCTCQLSADACYEAFTAQDVTLGPGLRVIRALYFGPEDALAELQLEAATTDPSLLLHPALLDGTIQTLIRYEMENRGWLLSVILPTRLTQVTFFAASLPSSLTVVVRFVGEGSDRGLKTMRYNVTLCDNAGQVLLTIQDFVVKLLSGEGTRFDLGSSLLSSAQAEQPAPGVSSSLHKRVGAELTQALAQVLKMNEEQISHNKQLSELGLQSLILMELADSVSKAFEVQVAPTLFFEYSTIAALTDYCVENFGSVLKKKFGSPDMPETAGDTPGASLPSARFAAAAPAAQNMQEPIAIVGLSARLPQSADPESFWRHLADNADLIREIPPERWDWREYYGDQANQTRAKWGGFIDDVDAFDYRFFNYTPREAELMDPQQRLFLQCVWAALEDSGTNPASLAGSDTGVFVGGGAMDYLDIIKEAEPALQAQMVTGNVTTFLANRVSYLLNLRGPSEPVETACSASLIAIHRAVQAIRQGECKIAIAGGVNFILTPTISLAFNTMGIISQDGRCRVFDKSANGYVRSEGVGALVLMPLSLAEQNGHPVYGLIRGSGENHGGRANSITAPSPIAQKELLQKTYLRAGIDMRTLGYLEAHGTGTVLGDPIELTALTDMYRNLNADSPSPVTDTVPYCAIGSVKTNIGHLETAAGIAGVVKVLLMLRHRTIPGNPHLQQINPLIDLAGTPCYLTRQTQAWPRLRDAHGQELPRRAGISSFGAGGSNAHLILEEYAGDRRSAGSQAYLVFPFSAKSAERLRAVVSRMLDYFQEHADLPPAGVAYTLQMGREAMDYRQAWHAENLPALCQQMGNWLASSAESVRIMPSTADFGSTSTPDKIAAAWSAGAEVNWEQFYPGQHPQRVSLPSYPFALDRCWVGGGIGRTRLSAMGSRQPPPSPMASGATAPSGTSGGGLLDIIARVTKLDPQDITPHSRLHELGIDSILILSLINEIDQQFALGLTVADMTDKSVAELISMTQENSSAPDARDATTNGPQQQDWQVSQAQLLAWPELQILNKKGNRTPVFWFYSGFGTIQPYIPLAQALAPELPFLAFQASGIKGEKKYFPSLGAIAKYQAEIMMQVQPRGDFRLGGYSFGGTLAFETTRHLQLAGRRVSNIVMLDSFFPDSDFPKFSPRTAMVLTFISFLNMNGLAAGELYTRNVADQDLFDYLVDLGITRGLKYGRQELAEHFEKYMQLTDEALLNAYQPEPLPDSSPVLYFFARRQLQQFVCTKPGSADFDNTDILKNVAIDELEQINRSFAGQPPEAWQAVLPDIMVQVTEAEDHFRMLSNAASFARILDCLHKLYLG